MLLNELCRAAGTTRKAVAYYEAQGLISPRRQENGYREFTPEDARRVRRITLLRRLELPEHLTANGLLAVLNACYGAGEAEEILFSEAPAAAGRETEEEKEKIFPKTP